MAATTTRSRSRCAACALALVVLLAAAVGVAAAADTTDLGVAPHTDNVAPGDTTEVDVVVESADGGVGAINASVTLSDPEVATVADVTIHGDPRLENVTDHDDGVEISAALADTEDTGRVTILTLVLRGEASGQTAIDVNARALGDEGGNAYTVAGIERPTVTVADGSDGSGSDGSSRSSDGSDAGASSSGESDSAESLSGEPPGDDGENDDTDAPTADESGETKTVDTGEPTPGNVVGDGGIETSLGGGPLAQYGPVGALGVVAIGAIVIYRFR
ncbi:hypothetical protein [Halobellus rufus]|uniref:hypothetical protein n=1 Tax=Halobellus rufus TaxID=1448860 RepID=UPI0006799396|nr:hypothetical protein [Halobellus rufus]